MQDTIDTPARRRGLAFPRVPLHPSRRKPSQSCPVAFCLLKGRIMSLINPLMMIVTRSYQSSPKISSYLLPADVSHVAFPAPCLTSFVTFIVDGRP